MNNQNNLTGAGWPGSFDDAPYMAGHPTPERNEEPVPVARQTEAPLGVVAQAFKEVGAESPLDAERRYYDIADNIREQAAGLLFPEGQTGPAAGARDWFERRGFKMKPKPPTTPTDQSLRDFYDTPFGQYQPPKASKDDTNVVLGKKTKINRPEDTRVAERSETQI